MNSIVPANPFEDEEGDFELPSMEGIVCPFTGAKNLKAPDDNHQWARQVPGHPVFYFWSHNSEDDGMPTVLGNLFADRVMLSYEQLEDFTELLEAQGSILTVGEVVFVRLPLDPEDLKITLPSIVELMLLRDTPDGAQKLQDILLGLSRSAYAIQQLLGF